MTDNFEEICRECKSKMAGSKTRIVSKRFALGENCDRCGDPLRSTNINSKRKLFKVMK